VAHSTKWDNEETTRNRVIEQTNKEQNKQIKGLICADKRKIQKTPTKKATSKINELTPTDSKNCRRHQ
jgi:hypothetical protein